MKKRENFTVGRVAAFECEPGKKQSFFWDGKTPGLGVRVTPGSKAYIFETRLAGKTMRITIGDVRTWALGDAQIEARELKSMTDKGIDPRQVKAAVIAEAEAQRVATEAQREEAKAQQEADRLAQVPALDAWNAYLSARRWKWGERHYSDHLNLSKSGGEVRKRGGRGKRITQAGELLPLLNLPLNQIDADQVRQWLQSEVQARPTRAALAYRVLRAFLNWCADSPEYQGRVHTDACTSLRVREKLPKKRTGKDTLQREQLPFWFEYVRKLDNPVHSAYLQSLLLTGARRGELLGLRWQDIDFRWGSLTIRDKVDGTRTIPLTPYVASLLAALPRRNEWVFSSPMAASGRLQEPRASHIRALSAAGLPMMTLHGLRRSFDSLEEWIDIPSGVVAQIMGHKPSATAEKHYKVRPLDLLRMWHTKIEAWILNEAGIEQPATVTDGKLKRVI